ncbi:MAG: hypothetical protein KatS3mg013_1242 [Actinomycetota bacterium]|nr:MAG: hypothetical protein KatS3mg013_1242 [Actinomycetota bacterium]
MPRSHQRPPAWRRPQVLRSPRWPVAPGPRLPRIMAAQRPIAGASRRSRCSARSAGGSCWVVRARSTVPRGRAPKRRGLLGRGAARAARRSGSPASPSCSPRGRRPDPSSPRPAPGRRPGAWSGSRSGSIGSLPRSRSNERPSRGSPPGPSAWPAGSRRGSTPRPWRGTRARRSSSSRPAPARGAGSWCARGGVDPPCSRTSTWWATPGSRATAVTLRQGDRTYRGSVVAVSRAEDLAAISVPVRLPRLEFARHAPRAGEPVVVGRLTARARAHGGDRRHLGPARAVPADLRPAEPRRQRGAGPGCIREGRGASRSRRSWGWDVEGISFAIPVERVCLTVLRC